MALTYRMELPQKQGRWGQWKGVTFLSNWHPVVAIHDDEAGWQPTPFIPYHQPWYNEAGVFTARVRCPRTSRSPPPGGPGSNWGTRPRMCSSAR